jgi:hypothetical protein
MEANEDPLAALGNAELAHILQCIVACPDGRMALSRLGPVALVSRRLRAAVQGVTATQATRIVHRPSSARQDASPMRRQRRLMSGAAAALEMARLRSLHIDADPAGTTSSADGCLSRFLALAPARLGPPPLRSLTIAAADLAALAGRARDDGTTRRLPPALAAVSRLVLAAAPPAECTASVPPWSTGLPLHSVAAALLQLPELAELTLSEVPPCCAQLAEALPRCAALRSLTLRWTHLEPCDALGGAAPPAAAAWLGAACRVRRSSGEDGGGGGDGGDGCFWAGATQLRALALPALVALAAPRSLARLTALTALDALAGASGSCGWHTREAMGLLRRQRWHGLPPGAPAAELLRAALPVRSFSALARLAAPVVPGGAEDLLAAASELPALRSLTLFAGSEGQEGMVLPQQGQLYVHLGHLAELNLVGFEREFDLLPGGALARLTGLRALRLTRCVWEHWDYAWLLTLGEAVPTLQSLDYEIRWVTGWQGGWVSEVTVCLSCTCTNKSYHDLNHQQCDRG